MVVEGAAAAGIAALVEHSELFRGRTVGVILTGANIDPRLLAAVIQRGLVRSGRLSRLRVAINDQPGSLHGVLDIIGDLGSNLVEVRHQRMFADLPIRSVEVELWIETMDVDHRDAVVAAIRAKAYKPSLLPLDCST